jgi:hypothetical protein
MGKFPGKRYRRSRDFEFKKTEAGILLSAASGGEMTLAGWAARV